jgi:hypothetical protein
MGVESNPIAARLRMTYANGLSQQSFSGINPTANAAQLASFRNAVMVLQEGIVRDTYFTVDSELIRN